MTKKKEWTNLEKLSDDDVRALLWFGEAIAWLPTKTEPYTAVTSLSNRARLEAERRGITLWGEEKTE